MTVVYQSATELQRSASAATTTFAHSAGPGVSGVLVGFVKGGAAVTFSAVSYGGTTLVQYGKAQDTATEPGSAEWWFAPHTTSGSQNVAYNAGAVASNVHVVAITVSAAGTPWVQGQQIKQENTTSHSVSLTTGYVSGMAFGAFYGGAAAPSSLSYSIDRVLIHDWDFGAFYSEFFRHAAVTAAGVANPLGFGGDCPTSDDLAFAAVYITDGAIAAGSPQTSVPTVAGLIPSLLGPVSAAATIVSGRKPPESGFLSRVSQILSGLSPAEAPAQPTTGLVSVSGLAPTLYLEKVISPATGASSVQGLGPSALGENQIGPTQAQVSISGQQPSTYLELKASPTQGLSTLQGQQASLYTERLISPTTALASFDGLLPTVSGDFTVLGTALPINGLVTIEGRSPSTYLERVISPGTGSSVLEGRGPSVLGENQIGPTQGQVSISGQTPTTYLERIISPETGVFSIEGFIPGAGIEMAIAGLVVYDPRPKLEEPLRVSQIIFYFEPTVAPAGTVLPISGLVSISGLIPTLQLEKVISPTTGLFSIAGLTPEVIVTRLMGLVEYDPIQDVEIVFRPSRIILPNEIQEAATSVLPITGLVTVEGRLPTTYLQRLISPSTGAFTVQGRQVSLPLQNGVAPTQGQGSISGLAPALYTERKISPASGLVSLDGYIPTLTKTFPAGLAIGEPISGLVTIQGLSPALISDRSIAPDVGLVTLEGREPTLGQTVSEETIRGHATRRRGWAPTYEESLTASVAVEVPAIALIPEPIAYFDPPADRLAGMDSSLARIEAGVTLLDAKEALRRRRRREEEEIIQFLMRVA